MVHGRLPRPQQRHEMVVRDHQPKEQLRRLRRDHRSGQLASYVRRDAQARDGAHEHGVGGGRVDERAHHAIRPAQQPAYVVARVAPKDLLHFW